MSIAIGINGFGRMGRLTLRAAWNSPDFKISHINDPAGDAPTLAHLLNFDSVHGRWQNEALVDGEIILVLAPVEINHYTKRIGLAAMW